MQMQWVKGRIGFGDQFQPKWLADALNEMLSDIFFDRAWPDITLPVEWAAQKQDGYGGPPVEDPLTIFVHLPLGKPAPDERQDPAYVCESVIFKTSIGELVDDLLDLYPEREILVRVANALHEQADKIEESMRDS